MSFDAKVEAKDIWNKVTSMRDAGKEKPYLVIESALTAAFNAGEKKRQEKEYNAGIEDAAKVAENVSLKYTDDITGRAGETIKNILALKKEAKG